MSLQHEYGIFGGDDGAYILDFLGALRVPAAVTLHTVLDTPSPSQRAIVQKMAKAARARRDEPGRGGSAGAALRAAGRARRDHPARHPRHVAARPGGPQGALRRRRSAHAADLRPAGAEQGRRDRHPRAARPRRRSSRSRLLRRGRHASRRASPERRGLPHVARAAGRAAGRSRARRVPRSVRHDGGAVQLPAGGRRLREPVPQRGPGHERRALVRDGRGRRRSSRRPTGTRKELLADGRGRLFPFGDSAAPRRDDRGAVRRSRGARARAQRAATSTRAPSPGRASARNTCSSAQTLARDRHPRAESPRRSRARAACPSCASTTCCA